MSTALLGSQLTQENSEDTLMELISLMEAVSVSNLPKDACLQCKEVVPQSEETTVCGRKWHSSCAKCAKCDKSLINSTIARLFHFKLHCDVDYDRWCCCAACHEELHLRDTVGTANAVYHYSCFKCSRCSSILAETGNVFSIDGQMVCGKCSDIPAQSTQGCIKREGEEAVAQKASMDGMDVNPFLHTSIKCAGCGDPILGSSVQAGLSEYHMECFKCAICHGRIRTNSAKRRDGRYICSDCVKNKSRGARNPKVSRVLARGTDLKESTYTLPVSATRFCERCGDMSKKVRDKCPTCGGNIGRRDEKV
jgi:hypothetical protein